MHLAFRRGGRAAINKVMKQQPAVFLKLLVLLVPREMKVENSEGLKAMSDEQLEAAIEAIQGMLDAKVAGVPGRQAHNLATYSTTKVTFPGRGRLSIARWPQPKGRSAQGIQRPGSRVAISLACGFSWVVRPKRSRSARQLSLLTTRFLDEITLGPRAALASLTAEALDALGRIEEAKARSAHGA
jgi:hypothetical protein